LNPRIVSGGGDWKKESAPSLAGHYIRGVHFPKKKKASVSREEGSCGERRETPRGGKIIRFSSNVLCLPRLTRRRVGRRGSANKRWENGTAADITEKSGKRTCKTASTDKRKFLIEPRLSARKRGMIYGRHNLKDLF